MVHLCEDIRTIEPVESELMFVDILCIRCRLALPSAATSSACRYATTPFSNGRDFEPQNLHKDVNSNLKIL